MSETQVTFSGEEKQFLVNFLQTELRDARVEEHRTRTPSYREHIVEREHMLEGLLKKFGAGN